MRCSTLLLHAAGPCPARNCCLQVGVYCVELHRRQLLHTLLSLLSCPAGPLLTCLHAKLGVRPSTKSWLPVGASRGTVEAMAADKSQNWTLFLHDGDISYARGMETMWDIFGDQVCWQCLGLYIETSSASRTQLNRSKAAVMYASCIICACLLSAAPVCLASPVRQWAALKPGASASGSMLAAPNGPAMQAKGWPI